MTERPIRRHTRVRCWVRIDGHETFGYSTNLSATGIYVRVPREAYADLAQPLRQIEVGFKLPDRGAVRLKAALQWVNADDWDAAGWAAAGLGLRFDEPDPLIKDTLTAFVADYRDVVLVADADLERRGRIVTWLEPRWRALTCEGSADAASIVDNNEISVVIVGPQLSDMSGRALLGKFREALPYSHAACIALDDDPQGVDDEGHLFACLPTTATEHSLVQMTARATDQHRLSVENERLNLELERANTKLKRENAFLRQRLDGLQGFETIIGSSQALKSALSQLDRVRRSEATVHIRGETGTGKELVARALHLGGPRQAASFVAQNCGGMTESLLQSTLFGHEKGAFTGADRSRLGVFREANGGTLFLDEVAELPLSVQAALLRVLQEREVVPVGEVKPVKVDVRIVSATHKDLREEVRQGRFREDLYFRLMVISIELPPLRERAGDLPFLARHFLDQASARYGLSFLGFTPACLDVLGNYSWPGNVRELENEIERLVVLTQEGGFIGPEHLSPHLVGQVTPQQQVSQGAPASGVLIPDHLSYDDAVALLEQQLVKRALDRSQGVLTQAAALLGVERTRLGKIKKRLGPLRS